MLTVARFEICSISNSIYFLYLGLYPLHHSPVTLLLSWLLLLSEYLSDLFSVWIFNLCCPCRALPNVHFRFITSHLSSISLVSWLTCTNSLLHIYTHELSMCPLHLPFSSVIFGYLREPMTPHEFFIQFWCHPCSQYLCWLYYFRYKLVQGLTMWKVIGIY